MPRPEGRRPPSGTPQGRGSHADSRNSPRAVPPQSPYSAFSTSFRLRLGRPPTGPKEPPVAEAPPKGCKRVGGGACLGGRRRQTQQSPQRGPRACPDPPPPPPPQCPARAPSGLIAGTCPVPIPRECQPRPLFPRGAPDQLSASHARGWGTGGLWDRPRWTQSPDRRAESILCGCMYTGACVPQLL